MRNTSLMLLLAIRGGRELDLRRARPGRSPAALERRRRAPLGYYLRGARLLGTDEQGHVAYRILAERLEELPGEERLLLEGVSVEYQPANEVPWVISAGERQRAEGRIAARPRRRRRDSQRARRRQRAGARSRPRRCRFEPDDARAPQSDQRDRAARRRLAPSRDGPERGLEGGHSEARIRSTWQLRSSGKFWVCALALGSSALARPRRPPPRTSWCSTSQSFEIDNKTNLIDAARHRASRKAT